LVNNIQNTSENPFMRQPNISPQEAELREEIKGLADKAFHLKLIAGYGDGPDDNEYQIVYEGKPRHLPLERARDFLNDLIERSLSVE
jgi:hypothetical protein